ncbi:MAG: DUF359 domain-containing protein [Candidatus Bathyarchaeota archaeon]
MTDKACRECRIISYGSTSICPNCSASNLSDDFSGIVIIIDLLTDTLRKELKNPQGLLIEGPYAQTILKLKELIEKEKPTRVISVGDIVSQRMIEYGLSPNILIIDNKTMRKPIQPIDVLTDHELHVKNPPGSITKESWITFEKALKKDGLTKIIIDGEEDLLTVVAVLSAPTNSFVIYGQPMIGIVVVKVNKENRQKMQKIIDSMKETSKS